MGGYGAMTFMELLEDPATKRPVIGGHRGHQSDLRENTVRNFAQLLGTGIPYVEIDVQLTRDDQLVIFHDEYLEAATGLPGKVREYALDQLRKIFEIDTVEDSIRWCRENQMGIAFELKSHCLKTEEEIRTIGSKLSALIGQFDFHKNCFVFSKDYDTLALIRKLDEDISLGIIPPRDTEKALSLMEHLKADIYLDYLDTMSKPLVQKLHAAGYLVDGSVVNTEEAYRQAIFLGVDMIESDYPTKMKLFR
jgi:glycerophosphoryl diester phosphodiesterase